LVWTPLLLTTAAVVVVAGLERLARHVPALRRGAHAPEKLDSRDRPQV
jgi:hypothetical protein